MRNTTEDERGQLVLVASLVLALALVAIGVAYLQLGYHEDIGTGDEDPVTQLAGTLDRAVHDTATGIPGSYDWSERGAAAETIGEKLAVTGETLETSRLSDGHVYRIERNETHADQWVPDNCPSGPNRQFGSCTAIDGIAVQERNGRTHPLAVAFDIEITTPNRETEVTLVVEIRAT